MKEQALTIGQMENATKANGKIVKCKDSVNSHGQMVLSMWANLATTNFKVKDNTNLMTEKFM